MLSDWFDWMSYDKWADKWKPDYTIDIDERVRQQSNWVGQNDIRVTPTSFINGRKLPGRYSLDDLELLIPQVTELLKEESIN